MNSNKSLIIKLIKKNNVEILHNIRYNWSTIIAS